MHVSEIVIQNSGPITELHVLPQLRSDGTPKPLVLVGSNGGGKTSVLSIVADALVLLAATYFTDVASTTGTGHKFFRMIGSSTTRLGASYELNLVRFRDANGESRVLGKAGQLPMEVIAEHSAAFPELASLTDAIPNKITAAGPNIEATFRDGAYAFFPGGRAETPHWAQIERKDEAGNFDPIITNELGKPVVVGQSFNALKPWLIDLILDASVDALPLLQDPASTAMRAIAAIENVTSLVNINSVIKTILGFEDAHLVRAGRSSKNRKIMIARNGIPIIPSLEALSAGQASLLAIFGTILRYGDMGQQPSPLNTIPGVVCIDEIDAQLHPKLQYEVLPKIIALFPHIQFIVSSHSPLFPLGMAKHFGEDGFTLLNLPEGTHVPVERYDDFSNAFEAFRSTERFENAVHEISRASSRPLVLCEGETDPKYLRTAAEVLGFTALANECDLDWLGQNTLNGPQGSGKSNLNDAWKFLTNNPAFATRDIVLLYDNDARKPAADSGRIHVRSMPDNPENKVAKGGVEVLLPERCFEDKFYRTENDIQGTTRIGKQILDKRSLCAAVCENRAPADFEGFRTTLQILQETLLGPSATPEAGLLQGDTPN